MRNIQVNSEFVPCLGCPANGLVDQPESRAFEGIDFELGVRKVKNNPVIDRRTPDERQVVFERACREAMTDVDLPEHLADPFMDCARRIVQILCGYSAPAGSEGLALYREADVVKVSGDFL